MQFYSYKGRYIFHRILIRWDIEMFEHKELRVLQKVTESNIIRDYCVSNEGRVPRQKNFS